MRRYSDEEVVGIEGLIVSGYTLLRIESEIGIPHSTSHKLVMGRLQYLDPNLYNECISVFGINKRRNLNIINERKKNGRTTTSTKSD